MNELAHYCCSKIKHINWTKHQNYTHQNKTHAFREKTAKISQFTVYYDLKLFFFL